MMYDSSCNHHLMKTVERKEVAIELFIKKH